MSLGPTQQYRQREPAPRDVTPNMVVRYVFGLLGGWDQAEDVALRSYDYHVDLPSGRVFPDGGETLLPILPSFGLTWEF